MTGISCLAPRAHPSFDLASPRLQNSAILAFLDTRFPFGVHQLLVFASRLTVGKIPEELELNSRQRIPRPSHRR
jgi:hypothetical protein